MSLRDGGSRTATATAAYRARDSARPEPICNDPWAHYLAGDEGRELVALADRLVPEFDIGVASRTELLDRIVRRAVSDPNPVTQVVVLGAGFDTRAARLAHAGTRFFEVDHPLTQAEKRSRLANAPGYPMNAAVYVQCDFEKDDFIQELVDSDLDLEAPTLVLWEGVSAYLSEEAVRHTLSRVAQSFRGRLLFTFDYLNVGMANEMRRDRTKQGAHEIVESVGEPFRFVTDDPLPILVDAGFRHVRTVSMRQASLSLTGRFQPEQRLLDLWWLALASSEALADGMA
jgi:methyltransferase (TIGR00027 family)